MSKPDRRQCLLLGLARSGVDRPRPAANDDELVLMRRLDELFASSLSGLTLGFWGREAARFPVGRLMAARRARSDQGCG